jgi:hypothetical protein
MSSKTTSFDTLWSPNTSKRARRWEREFASRVESSDKLLQFAVDVFLMDLHPDWLKDSSDDFPREFTNAVFRAVLKRLWKGPS